MRRILSLCLAIWLIPLAAVAGENLLQNPGFEAGFSGKGIAEGWGDDSSWAPLKAAYFEETENPHGGRSCQRIECTDFKGGSVQFRSLVPLEKGKQHTVSVWLRAREPMTVDVALRKNGRPYSTFTMRSLRVGTSWQECRFTDMIAADDPEALFLIKFSQAGTLYVDDAAFIPADRKGWGAMAFTPPAEPIPASLFGLHYLPYSFHKKESPKDAHPWPAVPFKTWRLWDHNVTWNWLERVKGQWDWVGLDHTLDLAARNGAEVIFPLALSPTWASARSNEKPIYGPWWMGCAAEPADLADWRNYVRTVVTRCKGKIKYYEGWNEPDIRGFYSGTKAKLVELQKEMFLLVKEIDPAAKVISPSCAAAGAGYLDDLFQAGLDPWIDIVGFHFYTGAGGPEFGIPKIQFVREIMESHRCRKPLFNTEMGWSIQSAVRTNVTAGVDTGKVIGIEKAGEYIARTFLLHWAMGIPVSALYRWEGSMGLREDNGDLKTPAVNAFKNVAAWMTGAVMTSCARSEDGTYTVQLKRDGRVSTILWNADETMRVAVPAGASKATDIFGNKTEIKGGRVMAGSAPQLLD